MKHYVVRSAAVLAILLVAAVGWTYAQQSGSEGQSAAQAGLVGTAFTYQGQLKLDGELVNNACDFQFGLYDALSLGNQVGISQTESITVTDGLFTANLNFGDVFTGTARWLGVAVRCGEDNYTSLGRQELTATPYALYALGASWSGLTDVPADLADGDDDTVYTVGAGLVMTDTEIGVDFNAVSPLTHTHALTAENVLRYFREEDAIPTNGALDWESFTIGNDAYLAVANGSNGSTGNINSRIYKWTGTVFSETQSIATNSAYDWKHFTIGDDSYLAVANYFNDSTRNINSKIYIWTGTVFSETQSIPTNGAIDWEFFTIGSDSYLAVANHHNDSTHNIDSKIYKWTGTSFAEFQSISTSGAYDWEFFTIGGDFYLAVANYYNGSTHNINSRIYEWNGASFTLFQSIPTNGANDWVFFTIDDDIYLAVANEYDDGSHNINSKIYRWNGANFAEFQSIPTIGANDWEFFTIGNDAYLSIANRINGSTSNINSRIYQWNGTNFVETQSIPTHGGIDWEFFTIGSDFYLAVANYFNDSTNNIDSKIYKASLQSQAGITYLWGQSGSDVYYSTGDVGVGTSSPQSALQVEGYVQLDTLTTAPPAADCDEAKERGRMKVDIINDLLYICTNSGWVAK